jgi:hypothetical protein
MLLISHDRACLPAQYIYASTYSSYFAAPLILLFSHFTALPTFVHISRLESQATGNKESIQLQSFFNDAKLIIKIRA